MLFEASSTESALPLSPHLGRCTPATSRDASEAGPGTMSLSQATFQKCFTSDSPCFPPPQIIFWDGEKGVWGQAGSGVIRQLPQASRLTFVAADVSATVYRLQTRGCQRLVPLLHPTLVEERRAALENLFTAGLSTRLPWGVCVWTDGEEARMISVGGCWPGSAQ